VRGMGGVAATGRVRPGTGRVGEGVSGRDGWSWGLQGGWGSTADLHERRPVADRTVGAAGRVGAGMQLRAVVVSSFLFRWHNCRFHLPAPVFSGRQRPGPA